MAKKRKPPAKQKKRRMRMPEMEGIMMSGGEMGTGTLTMPASRKKRKRRK